MLEPPRVPPTAYDAGYYLDGCLGGAEWSASGGADTHGAYHAYLDAAGLRRGEVLVDVGTGRGELVALAAERGAARAVGIEYSADAVAIARRTLVAHGDPPGAEVVLADARALPLGDATADVATLLDVVEHLTPQELATALGEVRRVLHPGGRVLVHTMPNRLFYDVTYRALQRLRPHWPADPRVALEHEMHVNEQTRRGLRRALRDAGFADARAWYGGWVHDRVLPAPRARRLVHALAARRATRWLGAADIWAAGRR